MNHLTRFVFLAAVGGWMAGSPAWSGDSKEAPAPRGAAAQGAASGTAAASTVSANAPTSTAAGTAGSTSAAARAEPAATSQPAEARTTPGAAASSAQDLAAGGDPLASVVIDDATLADARGGADTHLNQNTSTGTVTGNVASQLTTGSNMISEGSFSNSSGIPIVIQNSGNNVLIQNSTILNLQLESPK